MPDKKERVIITLAISISAIMLIAVVILRAVFFTPAPQFQIPASQPQTLEPQTQTKNYNHERPPFAPLVESPSKAVALPQAKPEDVFAGSKASPKTSLRDIVKAARTWGPAYSYSFGQKAPDFTLTDINGKQHKLSDYRGKDVLITFWATWCNPCKVEVPHLIALRNSISEDKLAMLAISYRTAYPQETAAKVEAFVEQNKINYTVFSTDAAAMPLLFRRISSIPCSFFVDSEGKIKFATEGLLSLGDIKAILKAEN